MSKRPPKKRARRKAEVGRVREGILEPPDFCVVVPEERIDHGPIGYVPIRDCTIEHSPPPPPKRRRRRRAS